MIQLFEDEQWKIIVEEDHQKNRFRFIHNDFMEITTTYMNFNHEMLLITQKVLNDITKEIEKGKTKSKYESFELLEDVLGNFLLTVKLSTYHNFTLTFKNYPADFYLDFGGHSFELIRFKNAIDNILEEQSFSR